MTERAILYPVFALVGLTFLVLACVGFQRIRATSARSISARDFTYGESHTVPAEVLLPNRNFMNLLELPVLFYLACLLLHVSRIVDLPALALAWAFVAVRFAHTAVHLSYNRVVHRMALFVFGSIALLLMWIRLFFLLMSSG